MPCGKPHYKHIRTVRGEEYKDLCWQAGRLERAGEINPVHDLIGDTSAFCIGRNTIFVKMREKCIMIMQRMN